MISLPLPHIKVATFTNKVLSDRLVPYSPLFMTCVSLSTAINTVNLPPFNYFSHVSRQAISSQFTTPETSHPYTYYMVVITSHFLQFLLPINTLFKKLNITTIFQIQSNGNLSTEDDFTKCSSMCSTLYLSPAFVNLRKKFRYHTLQTNNYLRLACLALLQLAHAHTHTHTHLSCFSEWLTNPCSFMQPSSVKHVYAILM